ncbi:PC-esterase domain-containing protein 1A-like isoform X2 [Sardina pilchardus]|uniref:PC-esterase domain-containing protein 1A-like isoform X2 n=1 Tax=Sardina pilchardus TaxID=27697 RepID=UPI002E15C733
MKTAHVSHQQASQLLHNKFVVVLGDSIHRGVYKDLVLLLQKDNYLAASQLKTKGEEQFENDELLEGGRKGQMSNGTQYKEVREFTSDHHRVRFYFVTRIYSKYMQSILEEFEKGPKPDLVIMNSCVWDVSRYGRQWEPDYMQNLTLLFGKMRAILPEEALIIWNLTMPLGKNIIGGFLVPEVAEFGPNLRFDIIEANYCSATLASVYGLDVLDLHFQFRFSLQHRMRDGVHWNAVAHRRMTSLMLAHIANAWGVELPPSQPPTGLDQSFSEQVPAKEVQQQPWKAQNSGYRCRPKEWRYNNYPVPATPWMTSNSGYRCRQKEWRYDYPVPATPWMTSNFYGEYDDQWMESPHIRQDFARDYVPPQAAPSYDPGFFIGYPQQDSNDYHYVMRKKHSRNAHYRPY